MITRNQKLKSISYAERSESLFEPAKPISDSSYREWLTRSEAITNSLIKAPLPLAISFQLIIWLPKRLAPSLAETLDCMAALDLNWHLIVLSDLAPPPELSEIDCIHWRDSATITQDQLRDLVACLETEWVIEAPPGTRFDEKLFSALSLVEPSQYRAVFSDDDFYDKENQRHAPRFKPGANPAALTSSDLSGPLCTPRDTWLTLSLDSLSPSPWFMTLHAVAQQYGWSSIKHLPQVLFSLPDHARLPSAALVEAWWKTLSLSKHASDLQVINDACWLVRWQLPSPPPSVQVIVIGSGDIGLIERSIASIRANTNYPEYKISVTMDAGALSLDIEDWIKQFCAKDPEVSFLIERAEGNFAKLANAAARASTAKYLLFINDETSAIQSTWLDELVRACSPEDIVAASPRLIQPGTGLIENTGNIIGFKGWISSAYNAQRRPQQSGDEFSWIDATRDVSTLTSACFIIRADAYAACGGMDEVNYTDQVAIADLSARLRKHGQRLLYIPRANLAGYSELLDPKYKSFEDQAARLTAARKNIATYKAKWWPQYATDPYWNQNLSLLENTPSIETEYLADWQFGNTEKPKILAHVIANMQADIRITTPLAALRRENRVSTCIWKQRVFTTDRHHTGSEICRLAPDVYIVQHYVSDSALAALDEWRQLNHRPFTVYALDDVITSIDPSNPFFKNFSADNYSRLKYALARCDRLVVSTDFLADHYRHLIPDIRVVPNRLESEKWLSLRSLKRTSRKPRIGWAGGTTHKNDLLLLSEVIKQTRDEADWVFFGMCPAEILPLVAEYHPFISYGAYPAFLASLNLDIAVAPLAITQFNQGKSNLRLLELGILGLPVVCTDITPYQNSPAHRVGNTGREWVSALRERIHDADARETEGGAMRAWVIDNYLLDHHLDDWLAAHLPD